MNFPWKGNRIENMGGLGMGGWSWEGSGGREGMCEELGHLGRWCGNIVQWKVP